MIPNFVGAEKPANSKIALPVLSPVSGEIVDLSAVPSAIINQRLLGQGVAIVTSGHKVIAPFDGTMLSVSAGKEQLKVKSQQGLSILIQVGVESYKLMTQGFKPKFKSGQKFAQGETLLEFDLRLIKQQCPSYHTVILTQPLKRLVRIQAHYHKVIAGQEPCMTLFFG